MTEWPPTLAPPDTSLGRLQRGLGTGARWAIAVADSSAQEQILMCVLNDPRWDSQLDQRADYYAQLALRLGMDAEPLEAFLKRSEGEDGDQDEAASLALDVLIGLAIRGSSEALAAVRRYIEFGDHWAHAIDGLTFSYTRNAPTANWREAVSGLDGVLCDRFANQSELEQAVEVSWAVDPARPPWSMWAKENARLGSALRGRDHRPSNRANQTARLAAKSTEELLVI
jgi:hypothetical protein